MSTIKKIFLSEGTKLTAKTFVCTLVSGALFSAGMLTVGFRLVDGAPLSLTTIAASTVGMIAGIYGMSTHSAAMQAKAEAKTGKDLNTEASRGGIAALVVFIAAVFASGVHFTPAAKPLDAPSAPTAKVAQATTPSVSVKAPTP